VNQKDRYVDKILLRPMPKFFAGASMEMQMSRELKEGNNVAIQIFSLKDFPALVLNHL